MNRAEQERHRARAAAEDPDLPVVDAVAAVLLGHSRTPDIRWVCSCGLPGRPGQSHYTHQAQAVLDMLDRRRAAVPDPAPDPAPITFTETVTAGVSTIVCNACGATVVAELRHVRDHEEGAV